MAGHRLTRKAGAEAQPRVDAYLGELSQLLRGPRRRRAQILAELRDGLDQAIADHTTTEDTTDHPIDVPTSDVHAIDRRADEVAVESAIDQFGTPQAVAGAFAGELATAYARHTVAWYIATGPLVGIWWLLLLQPHPWRVGPVAMVAAIPVVPLIAVAIATAAGTFATTGRLIRWLPEAGPNRALTAAVAITALVLASDVTLITFYTRSAALLRPLAILAIAASGIRIVCSLITLRHATLMRRGSTPTGLEPPRTGRHDVHR